MNKEVMVNNNVKLYGTVVSNPEFSHELYKEKFYNVIVAVKRSSGFDDNIVCCVSERLFDINSLEEGINVHIVGQFRSFNKIIDETHRRLVLSVFCREIEIIDNIDEVDSEINSINLKGFICKKPIYRKTPLGREITDLLVAVNRPYGKSDYIPCITWGRNAMYASNFNVGDEVELSGRIQSREYTKIDEYGNPCKNIAYEASISKIELIQKSE